MLLLLQEQPSSLHLLYMEELNTNIFVRRNIPESFDSVLWGLISKESPQLFQARQLASYEQMFRDRSLKEKYFEKFQRNHLNFYGWSLLVSREKVDLQPYLFKKILRNTPSFYGKKLTQHLNGTSPHRNSRTEPNELQKLIVSAGPSKQKEKLVFEEIDSHELYLQTYAACRGQRYTPFDHTRKIKLGIDKDHYNSFIRQKHKRNQSNPNISQNGLSKYAEWTQMKEKTSQLSFGSVLSNSNLNSERGLKTFLKRKGGQKLVFVNHQRKPVNYYIYNEAAQKAND